MTQPLVGIDDAVGAYLHQGANDTAVAVKNNVLNAVGTSADQAAQDRRVATATGIPLPTVQADPAAAHWQAAAQSFDAQQLAQRFPNTAQFLMDSGNAAITHDDIPATAAVEQGVKALGNPQPAQQQQQQNNEPQQFLVPGPAPSYRERLVSWMRDLVGLPPAGRDEGAAARAFLDVTAKRMGTDRQGLRDIMGGMSPVPQQFGQGFFDSFLAGLAPDNAGAPDTTAGGVARGAGDLAGFVLGLPLKAAGAAVEGLAGARLAPTAGEAMVKAMGKDVTRQAATLGLASAITATGRALDASTPDGAVATYLHAGASGAAMGATFGAAGRLFPDSTLMQAAARAVGTNVTLDVIQGNRPWDDRPLAQKVFDYGLNTIFSLNGAGRTGGSWLHDAARADAAAQDGTALSGIAQAATASKLRERDPEAFKQFVASAAQDGPVPAVYVDGTQLADALHQGGVGMDRLTELMPDVAKQLPEALSTGGQVRIPVEDFATHIAGSPLQDTLMPHLRTDPEGMTQAESEAFFQRHTEALQEEAQRAADAQATGEPVQASRQQVYDRVLEQLTQANRFRPDVNQAYAALQRDFYSTMAERLGVLPHELYERYPLQVNTDRLAGGAQLEQAAKEGPFGPIFDQFAGDPAGAIAHLKEQKAGEAIGALTHPEIGAIDLPWGVEGSNAHDGYGLAKLVRWHPEVVDRLQDILTSMHVTKRTENRAQLESDDHKGAVRLQWDGEAKKWLLTAFEKEKGSGTGTRTDTVDTAGRDDSPAHASDAIVDETLNKFYQGQRGAFTPATNTITLLKGADLSTFLHESGHFFLESLADMAAKPDAPEQIKADMQAVLKWMGAKDLADWQARDIEGKRSGHEQFARGFEAYLMEGKAPSLETASLFQRFRSWLLNVYQSLKALNVDLSPEVRGVFDRMLASDDAIRQAEQARGMTALFRTEADAQQHGVDFKAYQNLGTEATEKAVADLTSKSVRDMAWLESTRNKAIRSLEKDAAEKRKAIRREVESEVDAEPVYAAQRFIRRGEIAEGQRTRDQRRSLVESGMGSTKLSLPDLKAMYGDDPAAPWRYLRVGGEYGDVAAKGGLHPDLVADMFGFRSGDELVRALLDAEPRRSVVEGMTDQRMLERHGEIYDPAAMARTADALVHNEVRTRFIATELKALNKAVGPARELAKAAKEVAQAAIDARRVRDITPSMFTADEARAAKEAERRLAAGDTSGAAVAKRNQLLNNQLAKAAMDAQSTVEKALRYLAKFDKPSVRENIDLEYRDQIDALLDRYDLRKSVSNAALDKREALLSFVERLAAQGLEPQVPDRLLDEARRLHYKDVTLEEFKGLVDAVKSLEHLGRLKDRLLDLQETRKLNELADEARASAAKLPQRPAETNRGLSRIQSAWLNVKVAGRSLEASLLKMEQMMDWLDARNPNGVFNRVVFRRIADAGTKENDLLARVKGDIDKLVHENLADVTKDGGKVYVADGLIDGLTGQAQRFTKKQMLMLAGNMGNDSNAAKLLAGEKWQESAVWDFLNKNMGKADWDFVAGIGRALESLWPEKLAMSRRLGNTNPEKIQPRAFDTPHGRYDGWYWPMIYDPARAQDVAERGAKAGDALFENIYSRANTDTGRMNTRNANYARPLLLDLDAIPRVIKDEIHDIAFREAVIDADKFLSQKTVRQAVIDALSQQHYDQLRPWLQSIANDGKSSTENMNALKWFSDLAHGARTRATMVGLGYRISTMLVHGSSAAMESAAELGPKWLASGIKDFANPLQWSANRDFIFERSGEMRNRMNEVDRDVREHLREINVRLMDPASGAVSRGADIMKAHAYQGIAMLDMASALPTWMGAYKKAMSPVDKGGLGLGEQDAVYFADKTVRNAHGGTGVKDLAAVQRGPEFFKLFTMFYTFWNHNVNRLMDTAKLVTSSEHRAAMKEANHWTDTDVAGTVVMRTLIYTLGVQVMHGLFHPPKDDAGEESWLKWAGKEFLSSAFAGIPILRDLSAHYLTGKDYSVTPAASMVDAIGKSGEDAAHALLGQQVSDKWLKHSVTTAGYVFGLPTGQASSAVQFLWDVGGGHQSPQDAADWWRGIMHGTTQKH
ncbi:hypothetical protein JK151_08845 [Ralstonia syzygii subsp. celebesensis]|uniref:Large polyvalent protein associated domain-containing protein n=2 Tax=Ralstonia syzygii subsp. celebesensis TaxID=1310168 RepID=A0A1U9VEM1_9RALS|nr:hypothetical protein [Ralstonia syzygii]AQW29130.1 hypothetical protein B0B51_03275 [blood disease bacterium A2-HR MARDI]QQV54328.1 hypothetical protein JK151_08845 [Ralstonia syzygii subsp. celebesensis]CCA79422.1 putative phage protein p10 [blood disease bacterium R229]